MRPDYETQEDRDNQLEIIIDVSKAWNCAYELTPSKCSYDAVFVDKESRSIVKAFGETKDRTTEMNAYTEYMISFEKWTKLILAGLASKLPVLLVVRFKDKLMWCDLMDVYNTEGAWRVGYGKRNKRGDKVDPADREPMVFIQNNQFKELKVGN